MGIEAPQCGAFSLLGRSSGSERATSERQQERTDMEKEEREIGERLEAATTLLEKTLSWLEERQGALSGEVERITATVDQSRREAELEEKLTAVERELADLKASAAAVISNPLRR